MSLVRYDKLSEEEKNQIRQTEDGSTRLLSLQNSAILELKQETERYRQQIVDKEEAAARWMNLLIVVSLFQLFPFTHSDVSKIYLLVTLPSLLMSFYSTSYTLLKHPNYVRPDFFVSENEDVDTNYYKNENEIKALQIIFASLGNNYLWKNRLSGFIGPSIIVNFTLSIFYLILVNIFNLTLTVLSAVAIGAISIFGVYLLKKILTHGLNIRYTQGVNGDREFEAIRKQ